MTGLENRWHMLWTGMEHGEWPTDAIMLQMTAAAPDSLLKVIHCNCSSACRTFCCSCRRCRLPCTAVCGPCQHQNCDNPNKSAQSNFEEGRVVAPLHMYALKSPFVTMVRPKFAPKSTPSSGPIAKPHYMPHPWTRPTYDAKQHTHPICRFSTMHWTDRRTDRQIIHGKVWSL